MVLMVVDDDPAEPDDTSACRSSSCLRFSCTPPGRQEPDVTLLLTVEEPDCGDTTDVLTLLLTATCDTLFPLLARTGGYKQPFEVAATICEASKTP